PVMSLPGAPDSVLAESARERAWAEFVVRKREPAVAPVVLHSWMRSRDMFQIDPALKRSPIVLPEDESCQRRERMEALGVAARHRGGCTGAPIRHPITGETIAVIDVTGYKDKVQAHTLLAVQATAALIEQRLLLEFTLDEKLLCDRLFAQANRMPSDAMLAVDRRGRVVQLNAAAERLLTVRRPSGGQTLRDELRPVVEGALER